MGVFKHRWFFIILGTSFLILFCAFFWHRQCLKKMKMVRAIETHGGTCTFFPRTNFGKTILGLAPYNYCRNVRGVNFCKRSDPIVFWFNEKKDVDAVMPLISRMKNVQEIGLENTQVSSEGILHLAGLRELRDLNLSGTELGDDEFQAISKIQSLNSLDLYAVKLQDQSLLSLSELGLLTSLSVSHTRVTDEGVSHLAKIAGLKILNLNHTDVTDNGLSKLANLDGLEELSLCETNVTDLCVAELVKMKSLSKLDLRNTDVSIEAVKEIQDSFETISVEHGLVEIDWR